MSEPTNETEKREPSFRDKILEQLKQREQEQGQSPALEETVELPLPVEPLLEVDVDGSEELDELDKEATLQFQLEETEKQSKKSSRLEDTLVLSDTMMGVGSWLTAKPDPQAVRRHRRKQQKTANKIVATVILLVLLALGIAGYKTCTYIETSLKPYDSKATHYVQVEIPYGSSTKEIAAILEKNKLIRNATVFNYYAKLKSYNNFQSGFYNLSQTMSVDELAKALQEIGSEVAQDPIDGKVRVIEGSTIEQIALAMTDNVHTETTKDKTPFTKDEFLATIAQPEFIASMVAKYPGLLGSLPAADSGVKYQLEGYLFPATYSYTEKTTVAEMIDQMLAAMDSRLQAYYGQLEGKGLTVNELLTLASLVEKEGATDEDRRNIASVFYNRLNTGMPLQSNIAILYAMGKLGQETTLAEDAGIDTAIDSPYNIYVHTDLMPGPVDSPSLDAIEATFSPNQTPYFYFVADVTTGKVYYSETIEQHDQYVEQYVNSRLTATSSDSE